MHMCVYIYKREREGGGGAQYRVFYFHYRHGISVFSTGFVFYLETRGVCFCLFITDTDFVFSLQT